MNAINLKSSRGSPAVALSTGGATATNSSNDLLRSHKRELDRVVAINADPLLTRRARSLLARVEADLRRPAEEAPTLAGRWGPNGWGPAVADIVKDSDFFTRMNTKGQAA